MKFFGKDSLNGFSYNIRFINSLSQQILNKKIHEYRGVKFFLNRL